MQIKRRSKQINEIKPFNWCFLEEINSKYDSGIIQSVAISAVDLRDDSNANSILQDMQFSATIDQTENKEKTVYFKVNDSNVQTTYKITILLTLDNGLKPEDSFFLDVL
jgi:hypothetical protein